MLILGEAYRFFPEFAQVIDECAMAFSLSLFTRRVKYCNSSFGSVPSAIAGRASGCGESDRTIAGSRLLIVRGSICG